MLFISIIWLINKTICCCCCRLNGFLNINKYFMYENQNEISNQGYEVKLENPYNLFKDSHQNKNIIKKSTGLQIRRTSTEIFNMELKDVSSEFVKRMKELMDEFYINYDKEDINHIREEVTNRIDRKSNESIILFKNIGWKKANDFIRMLEMSNRFYS